MDPSISRSWEKYIEKTKSCGVEGNSMRCYVRHVEAYINAYVGSGSRNIPRICWKLISRKKAAIFVWKTGKLSGLCKFYSPKWCRHPGQSHFLYVVSKLGIHFNASSTQAHNTLLVNFKLTFHYCWIDQSPFTFGFNEFQFHTNSFRRI